MTVPDEEATANYVPAAAVIRRWRALSGIIGRKGRAGGHRKLNVKSLGLTREVRSRLRGLNTGEDRGIPGVEVKFVDIRRNTRGEGDGLDRY